MALFKASSSDKPPWRVCKLLKEGPKKEDKVDVDLQTNMLTTFFSNSFFFSTSAFLGPGHMWSRGWRWVRQWLRLQTSQVKGINSLFLQEAIEHRFLKTGSPCDDLQFCSMCSLTVLSADSPARTGTVLLQSGQVIMLIVLCWSSSPGQLWSLNWKWDPQKIWLQEVHLMGRKSVLKKN